MDIRLQIKPELDPEFIPAVLWNRAYLEQVDASEAPVEVALALMHPDGNCSRFNTRILPLLPENEAISLHYLERTLKFLLWQRGGCKVLIAGCGALADNIAAIYAAGGARSFDFEFFGDKVYGSPLEILACTFADLPETHERTIPLGRHMNGCRIGFDLVGSDRKCAAMIDGEVVFS